MGILSKLLATLGLGPPSGETPKGAPPGTLSAPPELTPGGGEGPRALTLFIERYELLPLGSQVLHAVGSDRGRRAALEVVLGPDWRAEPLGGQPAHHGVVTFRSAGSMGDALLRFLDELYETKLHPPAMARLTDFACLTLGGDPQDLRSGRVRAKLRFEAEDGEGSAELFLDVDLPANRLELREKDPADRAAVVRALMGAPSR